MSTSLNLVSAHAPDVAAVPVTAPALPLLRVRLVAIASDGCLIVRHGDAQDFACDWLDSGPSRDLTIGDELLALGPGALTRGVVLGRVGPYAPVAVLLLEATQTVSLKCGGAKLTLNADGSAALQGEDLLLRAKGTQRIRAGTVAIN